MLIAFFGKIASVKFDDVDSTLSVLRIHPERNGREITIGVEAPISGWRTEGAVEAGCGLLEVKAGPFDSAKSKILHHGCQKRLILFLRVLGLFN